MPQINLRDLQVHGGLVDGLVFGAQQPLGVVTGARCAGR
jgi:hypothetical protein